MRSTKKEYDLHCGRLTGGTTPSELAESIEFFARLATNDKLPKQIDPQLIEVFISTAKHKGRLLAVRGNAMNILVKMLEHPSPHTHTLVDKGIIGVLAETVVGGSDELRTASALAARHIADCCGDCRTKLIEAGVDNSTQQQIDISISIANDKRRTVAVRANALSVLAKLLEGRSRPRIHVLVEKGIVDALAGIIVGKSDELRAAAVHAARFIADCCRKCRTALCQAEVDTRTMQQLIAGGFDASAEATRGAVSLVVTGIWIGQLFRVDATVARDVYFPALARSLSRLGADDDEKVVMDALRFTGKYELLARHSELVDYLTSFIATTPVTTIPSWMQGCLGMQSSLALELLDGILPFATPAQLRSVVDHPGFMLNVARWVVLCPDGRRIAAERILDRIASAPLQLFADAILANPALISALTVPLRGRRGHGGVKIIMKILHASTAGGPTTQSQFLLGYGFLPRVIRNFSDRSLDLLDDATVQSTRSALYAVINAHPEWARKLHEAGASNPPLLLAIQLRAKRLPQQYILCDEDCDVI